MKPGVQHIDNTLHLSYDLPHRIHSAKIYPVPAPNESSIIIYGHEHGLRVIWTGGRPLKKGKASEDEKPKSNGITNDAVMVIASDDEELPVKPTETFRGDPEFEDEVAEHDPAEPSLEIVQDLDLPLSTDVLHISVPPLSAGADMLPDSIPRIFSERLVLGLACSDCSVRVLTLPLMPPSKASKARLERESNIYPTSTASGRWGEQMLTIPSGIGHQNIPSDVTITFTSAGKEYAGMNELDEDDEDDEGPSHQKSQSSTRSRSGSRYAENPAWDLLVGSHSATLSGLLLVHRVRITADESGNSALSVDLGIPWCSELLPSPASSISFNTSLYPAEQHTHLLIAEARGAVRVYNPQTSTSGADRGTWLMTFLPSLDNLEDYSIKRKDVLDAKWVLGGKAILTLLADGEWGIWDVDDAGPKPKHRVSSSNPTIAPSSTAFAISGWIGSSANSASPSKISGRTISSKSKLAPLTPGTRKIKQEALFIGPTNQSSTRPAKGGISVVPVISTHPYHHRTDDESILIWYCDSIITISSLLVHWHSKITGSGNLFDISARGQIKEIKNVNLGGELRNGVVLFPTISGAAVPISQETLVIGEHRIKILAKLVNLRGQNAVLSTSDPSYKADSDQFLLTRGELDIDGVDRVIESMSNGLSNSLSNGIRNGDPYDSHSPESATERKLDFMRSR